LKTSTPDAWMDKHTHIFSVSCAFALISLSHRVQGDDGAVDKAHAFERPRFESTETPMCPWARHL